MSESLRDVLAREAAEAEARAEAEEQGEVAPPRGQRGRKRSEDPSQVYAVRIPVSRLKELRQFADGVGEAPSALIRRWIVERLDAMAAETADGDMSASINESVGAPLEPGKVRLGSPRRKVVERESKPDTVLRRRKYA